MTLYKVCYPCCMVILQRDVSAMPCIYCNSSQLGDLKEHTSLGYRQWRCYDCKKQFNERTATPFNRISYRTEIVVLVVYHRLRFKLSLDDVVELMATRNVFISHQTVQNWTQWFGPVLGIQLRKFRRNTNGKKWHVDHTEIKVSGRTCYLYRCFDKNGDLVDVMLSDNKSHDAAESFFYQCHDTAGFEPDMITTDQEAALESGLKEVFGERVEHRKSKYMNNRLEQDHRAPKSRYRPMKGFGDEFAAMNFLHSFEELRQHLRAKGCTRSEKRRKSPSKINDLVSLVA